MSSDEISQPDPHSNSPQLHQKSKKRKLVEDIEVSESHVLESNIPKETEAANFNRRVMKRLQKAYEKNPEVDLYRLFPVEYSGRLQKRIEDHEQKHNALAHSLTDSTPAQHVQHESREAIETDIRSNLDPCCPVEIVHPLSSSIRDLIDAHNTDDFSSGIAKLLAASEVIYLGPFPSLRTVFRCSPAAVVKAIWDIKDYTEHTMLQFLDKHAPEIPTAKPLGVLRIGKLSLIFSSCAPGQQLTNVWPQLQAQQKVSFMSQLSRIICDLRSVPCPPNQPLGGVAGEGCKDARRHVRQNKTPIYTVAEHDSFLFSHAHFGSEIYLNLLRSLAGDDPEPICLSHGDIRPDNIIVQQSEDGSYTISGLIDWEFGGFYPSHYECTKATNCLGTDETSDWYSYLPSCIAPRHQAQRWLLDYVLERLLE